MSHDNLPSPDLASHTFAANGHAVVSPRPSAYRSPFRLTAFARVAFFGLIVGVGACAPTTPPASTVVVTDYGLGLDKWATAWLMARHAIPGAQLNVVAQGMPLTPGVAFDVPTSPLRRERDHAAFQAVIDHYKLAGADLARMSQIVRDIEVNYWGSPDAAESPAVESAFRRLQIRYGRYSVSPECYLAFYDRVFEAVRAGNQTFTEKDLDVDCHALASKDAQGALVPEMPLSTLLTEIKAGKKVAFVDVREPDEFAEAHIPDAHNITLRDLDENDLAKLRDADYVISYCIKDFRGFEMARSLRDAGIGNAVILNPYGIKGWIAEGMPTVGAKAMTPIEGRRRLSECVTAPETCKAQAEHAAGGHSK